MSDNAQYYLILSITILLLGIWVIFAVRKYLRANKIQSLKSTDEKEKSLKMINQWQGLGSILIIGSIVPFLGWGGFVDFPIYFRVIVFLFGFALLFAGNKDKKKL